MRFWRSPLVVSFFALLCLLSVSLLATETENFNLQVLPAPGKVVVDGKTNDWNLTGGVFVCCDVERFREHYAVWYHAMYDNENLYLLARWMDPTPMNHPGSVSGSYGFHGDCLQVRFIADYEKKTERVSHWDCWRDKDGIQIIQGAYGRGFKDGKVANALKEGAQQAFLKDKDGKGYVQEIAIPWKLLTSDGKPVPVGSSLRTAVEPNYTAGASGRVSIKGIFRPGITPDRIFTFRAYRQWGEAMLLREAPAAPRKVRLADAREFAVCMQDGSPVVDWEGLIKSKVAPGFKDIAFKMPFDGEVSLNLYDKNGKVVRQLLTANFFAKGDRKVQWDGLTTTYAKDPGMPVEAGEYTWKAIANPGVHMKLRGWAHNGGNPPWSGGGPKCGWGGNHGTPVALDADNSQVFLGWSYAEGPCPLLAVNADGDVQWRLGMGGKDEATYIATMGDITYAAYHHNQGIYRVNTKTGDFVPWEGKKGSELDIHKIFGKGDDWPYELNGLAAADGKVFLSFGEPVNMREKYVKDWKAFLEKLTKNPGILSGWDETVKDYFVGQIKPYLQGRKKLNQLRLGNFVKGINNRMSQLAEVAAADTPLQGRIKVREQVAKEYGDLIRFPKGNFVAVIDGKTGSLSKMLDVVNPTAIRIGTDGSLLVVSNGESLVSVNVDSGKVKPIKKEVGNLVDVAQMTDGNIALLLGAPVNQIAIVDSSGKVVKTLGAKGGRPETGLWQKDAMRNPHSIVQGPKGNLWVAESLYTPKRFVVWNPQTGKVVKEFFGPTMYGASGGAVNPRDPNRVVGHGCEWQLDPKTGRATCLAVFDTTTHGFACYREGTNGKLYLFAKYGGHLSSGNVRIFENSGPGKWKVVADLRDVGQTRDGAPSVVWTDLNGNGKEDKGEVEQLKRHLTFIGSNGWSLSVGNDMALYSADTERDKRNRPTAVQWNRIPVKKFAASGAPTFDFANAEKLTAPAFNQVDGACAVLPSPGNEYLLVNQKMDRRNYEWACYDGKGKELLWTYPNPYFQVHGSHRAPPPTPGLFRGGFGIIGTAKLPEPLGNVWFINTNCGEWHVLNEKGMYITRLFEPDPFKRQWPGQAVPGVLMDAVPPGSGGEDFGGSVTQGKDGRIHVQSGKAAYWYIEAVDWDKIADLGSGTVTISKQDVETAKKFRVNALQAARGTQLMAVKKGTPTFTGDPRKDFAAANETKFVKKDGCDVSVRTLWDENNLYVCWDVRDTTPWVNNAGEAPMMYASGDTVDLQLGTDLSAKKNRREEAKGDVRISIGPFQGKPTVMVYRKHSDVKKPRMFGSGVIAEYPVDYVAPMTSAKVEVKADKRSRRYIVEAALPLKDLGLKLKSGMKIRGDFGVTHGDDQGENTVLRTHWSNQDTGLIDDVVFELKTNPSNWGEIMINE